MDGTAPPTSGAPPQVGDGPPPSLATLRVAVPPRLPGIGLRRPLEPDKKATGGGVAEAQSSVSQLRSEGGDHDFKGHSELLVYLSHSLNARSESQPFFPSTSRITVLKQLPLGPTVFCTTVVQCHHEALTPAVCWSPRPHPAPCAGGYVPCVVPSTPLAYLSRSNRLICLILSLALPWLHGPWGGALVKPMVEWECNLCPALPCDVLRESILDGFKLFVLSVCCITCITSFALAESDIKKLYTLRDSFAGTKDLLQSWFDPETPPCHWSGITCKGRTVVAINLSSVPLRVPFPSYIVAFQSLVGLYFRGCGITGVIPEALGKLQHLHYLDLSNNQLTGSIPVSLYKLKMLKEIVLDKNSLSGQLSAAISQLHHLTKLSISMNSISGELPSTLGSLQNLESLALGRNHFTGSIPNEVCNLKWLKELSLLECNLSGTIPWSIGRMKSLQELDLSGNNFNTELPASIGELKNLTRLSLNSATLRGSIPKELGNCKRLAHISLSTNGFTGSIPDELAEFSDLVNLRTVDLSFNSLVGPMLPCKSLYHLDVSSNNLSGQIPLSCARYNEFSSLLVFFNASFNHFSGSLDESISNFTQLSFLDIHNNSLTGSLPSALSNVNYLSYLDLSNNDFSGIIPCGICNMSGITFANFSGNHIGMHSLSDCLAPGICIVSSINHNRVHPPHHVFLRVVVICVTTLTIAVMLALLVVYVRRKLFRSRTVVLVPASEAMATSEPTSSDKLLVKKSWEPPSINVATFESALLRVTADDILKATDNFSEVHIIGGGGFGIVYRATLPEGQTVAIKRLHGDCRFHGDRAFLAEMETIGKVKHRNLVPLLGYCAHGDERFLVYEYMHHGSLETWLRNRADAAEALGWTARLKICVGSACGLMFLHHGFVPHIIHRDMKSSNILLDENMESRVSDFGLARIISAYETHVSTNVAGTLGYIPPEYGMAMKCTAKGDVYSFGVVMLEVLTGRPPTGQEMEEGGGNLVGWVRWMIANGRQSELFDPCLPVSGLWREQMSHVLAIARKCTVDEPWKRPTMVEVVKGLRMIQLMKHEPDDLQEHVEQA
ncbi:hypothetical protein PR202_gb06518 [Eleusine coracana subsp. coracana]|uniref:non-specific serine/threonine protein kinase n=1 Tax=Eleusine coracana subsp. coracana TaxID=191504 RepID=A0AAV5E931_ELECO|nr:hypothetical protein PR202_gb06518 [Eleusine coracana subsp. coracana]